MDIKKMKVLSYDELRATYKDFLHSQSISELTINTAYVDSFYLWRKVDKDLFWNVVSSPNFESIAKSELLKVLSENSTGNVKSLVNNYSSHLRRFRLFLASKGITPKSMTKMEIEINQPIKRQKKSKVEIPEPSINQVEIYLERWEHLENYRLQENALNKLFIELCPRNLDISDILLKASTLNNFYSTNIFSIYPVAKHIYSLDIDSRLQTGDVTLVRDIQYISISDTQKNFYSFATKYCSHHNPIDFPIYDSFVYEILRYFRKRDGFSEFEDKDLKDYIKFKTILTDFKNFYSLDKFNLKQIDQYVWQLGKDFFPKDYGKKKQGDKSI